MRLYEIMWLLILLLFAGAQALVLTLTNTTWLSPVYISELHFFSQGNNFGWAIVWRTPVNLVTPQTITLGANSITCITQLRWVYYNNQRWQRLLPLDDATKSILQNINSSYSQLALVWWRYTWCTGVWVDPDSIIGQITFDNNWLRSYLTAGVQFDNNQNNYTGPLRNSLQYVNNNPLGYIYDSYWWIWFLGGVYTEHTITLSQIAGGDSIKDIFILSGWVAYGYEDSPVIVATGNAIGNTWSASWVNIAIQGILATTSQLSSWQLNALEEQALWLVLPTTSFTRADVTNQLRRRANQLCQWRPNAQTISDPWPVLCFYYNSYSSGNKIQLDLATANYSGKTIIIKNWNIEIIGTMWQDSPPLDLFIDNGNLQWRMVTNLMTWFDVAGNPATTNVVASGFLLKGNIFIDGLFIPTGTALWHKWYIHGKLLSLHTTTPPTQWKINQITNKFGSGYVWFINITDVFTWRCQPSWLGTDGSICASHIYQSAPFVLIDRTYPSLLLLQ
jgi:hypothetical protein